MSMCIHIKLITYILGIHIYIVHICGPKWYIYTFIKKRQGFFPPDFLCTVITKLNPGYFGRSPTVTECVLLQWLYLYISLHLKVMTRMRNGSVHPSFVCKQCAYAEYLLSFWRCVICYVLERVPPKIPGY